MNFFRSKKCTLLCYQFFRKESTIFTPKNMLFEQILATSLANYEGDSLDDDSFVSQSRFDAYPTRISHLSGSRRS